MRNDKILALLASAVILFGSVPGMQTSAESVDVEAIVQAANEANSDYSVVVHDLQLSAESVGMLESGYAQLKRAASSNDAYDGYVYGNEYAMIDKNGTILFPYSAYGYSYINNVVSSASRFGALYNQKCEYYSIDGNLLTEKSYDFGTTMSNNIAVVADITDIPDIYVQQFANHSGYYMSGMLRGLDIYLVNADGERLYTLPKELGVINIYSEDFKGVYGDTFIGFGNHSEGLIGFSSTCQFGNSLEDPILSEDSVVGLGTYDTSINYYMYLPYQRAEYQCGYMDVYGNIVIPQQFDDCYSFSEERALVEKNGMYGFINKSGEVIIPLEYDNAASFKNGLAKVKTNGKYGFLNTSGEVVIPFEYDDAGTFSNSYTYALKNEKYGYIDKDNNTVIPFEYDSAYGAGDNLFSVGNDGKFGMVDKNNQIVIPMIFDDITNANSGVAYAILNGNVYSLEISPVASSDLALGDLNGDTEIDSSDAAAILMAAAAMGSGTGSSLTEAQFKAADVNGDGTIDAADAAVILAYTAAKGAGQNAALTDFIS